LLAAIVFSTWIAAPTRLSLGLSWRTVAVAGWSNGYELADDRAILGTSATGIPSLRVQQAKQ
jgi:hypothetical protein